MRLSLISVAAFLISSPVLACDGGMLFELMETTPPPLPDASFEVAEVDSTEGGEWQVWLGPDGRTARYLVRNDYGEGGRYAARLIVSSPAAFAVTSTVFIYSAPNYVEGATTVREEKDIFVFCDGRLLLPAEDFGLDPDYQAKAAEALKTFDAGEVAAYMPALRRE